MDSLQEIQKQCREDSERWFGPELLTNLPHHVLALCGESGELANQIKKLQRPGNQGLTEEVMQQIAHEVVDVFIYCVTIANILNLDLGTTYTMKRGFNCERWD